MRQNEYCPPFLFMSKGDVCNYRPGVCLADGPVVSDTKSPSPYLHEFVKKSDELVHKLLADGEALTSMEEDDSDLHLTNIEKYTGDVGTFETEMIGLLKFSFEHHDSDGDGVLSEAEADAFFGHLVGEHVKAVLAFGQLHKAATVAAMTRACRERCRAEMQVVVDNRHMATPPEGMSEEDKKII